jgi:AraC-like DNA-binding protein
MTITTLLFIGIAISMFSIFLALSKKPTQISDKIFVAFLLSIIVPMMIALVKSAELSQLVVFRRLDDFMPLTLGPFIAIYAESLTKTDYDFTKSSLYHFLPFVLFFVIGSSYSQFISDDATRSDPFQIPYSIMFLSQTVYYSIWIPKLLRKHRARVLDYYAHNPNHISLTWLVTLVYIGFIFFACTHIPLLLDPLHLLPPNLYFESVSHSTRAIGFVFFLCVLSFFGVKQTQVFTEISASCSEEDREKLTEILSRIDQHAVANFVESSCDLENAIELVKTKKCAPIIHDDQLQEYLERLEEYVETEKPHLDSELTLGSLATLLDIPKHHLTETLNRKLHKNFYSYINELRLEDVKKLLLDPKNATESILTLSYQAGFNSKTTFNSFFKKATLMTPSQFRKSAPTKADDLASY